MTYGYVTTPGGVQVQSTPKFVRHRWLRTLMSPQTSLLLNVPGVVIAGGAARYDRVGMEAPPPGDIDLFVLQGADHDAIGSKLVDLGYRYEPDGKTMKNELYPLAVQLVDHDGSGALRVWDTPENVIATFGFTTEMFALYLKDDGEVECLYSSVGYTDTINRVLHINHIIDPVRLAYRAVKYGRKGYSCTVASMLPLFAYWDAVTEDAREAWRAQSKAVSPDYRI